ncbi:MAG: PIG-L family deacetylase [Armatimonadota bacterium]
MRRIRITKHRIILAVGIWAIIIIVPLALTAIQLQWGNLKELNVLFGKWQTPGTDRRIIVFAPHCDDEVIAAGGLIHQAAASGAKVTVVLMTNGDGSRYAARIDSRSIMVSPKYYVGFGYRRQKETRAALATVSSAKVRIITLGYPDRGLEQMWISNWNTPFVSKYTHDSRSPYTNSMTRNAPFTGKQLMSDVKKLLREIDPTDIYIPHPCDQHPDHWATGAFVTEALYDEGWLEDRNVGLYLVHRGDWPLPQGLHAGRNLAPPAGLDRLDTRWYQYELNSDSVSAKKCAMDKYRSQTGLNRRFLLGFVRKNELFGIRDAELDLPHTDGIRIDGSTGDWDDLEPVIVDPQSDGIPSHSQPSADLTEVYAAEDKGRLYFMIKVRGAISKAASFNLRIRPLRGSNPTTVVTLRKGAKPPQGWQVAFGKREMEASCPAGRLRNEPLMLAVGTKFGWFQIDRSAFRILKP